MNFKKFGIVYLLIFILAVLLIVRLVMPDFKIVQFSKLNQKKTASSSAEINSQKDVSITIDFGDSKTTNNLTAFTAYDALKKTADKQGIEIKVKEYDFGVFVESIGDAINTKDRAWIYYVNGQAGDVASDKKEIQNGDKVEWKYEKPVY